jgi:hypothetical protein
MRHAIAAFAAAVSFILTSCSDDGESPPLTREWSRTLEIPRNVTRIDVHTGYDGPVSKRIDSSADIQRILGFLDAHRRGWRYSDSGFPTPRLELFFYSGDQRLGRFGISCACYLESDLASEDHFSLRGIDAPDQDRHVLLDLLGMPDFHFEGEGCP